MEQPNPTEEQKVVASTAEPQAPVSTEVQPVSKTWTEEQVRAIQSTKDREVAEAKRQAYEAQMTAQRFEQELTPLKTQLQQMQEDLDNRGLEAYGEDGKALAKARQQVRAQQKAIEAKEKEISSRELEIAMANKTNQAQQLSQQSGLSADELMRANTPEEMITMAYRAVTGSRTKVTTQPPPIPTVPQWTPDRGISDAGGMGDDAFLRSYAEGKSDDHKRAQKLLTK